MNPVIMQVSEYPSKAELKGLLQRPAMDAAALGNIVKPLMEEVKRGGDKALHKYTVLFDLVEIHDFKVTAVEINSAASQLPDDLKEAIQTAAENITKFHEAQREKPVVIETTKGVRCWRKSIGIEKVGLYIPGGSAPLFSTVLMLGIPAKLAGCNEVILCTPPDKLGNIHPAILYAASVAGIKNIFKVGGAQAIAAMAYGTETIPAVYKIFGPGNQYVTAAKQLVANEGVAIDLPAGPSEVAVIADASCDASYVAADLLSQAEHGPDSQVLLVTDNKDVVSKVAEQLVLQLQNLPRKEIAIKALHHSRAILVRNMDEAMEVVNQYAPEHLILACSDAGHRAEKVMNAGSVFIGHLTPEAAGDYASGTNHTLPTNGYARAYSGVSLDSFVKKVTFQEINETGLKNLGAVIEIMAAVEQLDAHKNAVSIRLKDILK